MHCSIILRTYVGCFYFILFQARKGHPDFMFQLGAFYYYGLRGVRRDHSKALIWLLKAVEKGETRPFELIGEIYARGYGVERNYTKALEWFKAAAKRKQYSALNGIGFLYVKGQGVDGKNYTKVCLKGKLMLLLVGLIS